MKDAAAMLPLPSFPRFSMPIALGKLPLSLRAQRGRLSNHGRGFPAALEMAVRGLRDSVVPPAAMSLDHQAFGPLWSRSSVRGNDDPGRAIAGTS